MLSSGRLKSVARKSLLHTRPSEDPPVSGILAHPLPVLNAKDDQRNMYEKDNPGNDIIMVHSRHPSPSTEQPNGHDEADIHAVSNLSTMGKSKNQAKPAIPLPLPLPPKPDRTWVRHLISSRHRARKDGLLNNWHSGGSANSDEAWFRAQRDALTSGTLSMTLKCVLAAAEISTIFSVHAADFQKPEYRTRYWIWCKRFIKLVDFVIDERHSDPNVCQNVPESFQDIPVFVQNMREQRGQGLLPPPKEALLSALGVRWTPPQPSSRPDSTKREHGGEEGIGHAESSNSDRGRESGRKRRRSEVTNGTDGSEQQSNDKSNSRQTMKKWAAEFVKLRTHFRPSGSAQGRYEVPIEAADVRIWQNAEIARVSTGGSSVYCYSILKCAKVIDDSADHAFKPGREVSYWCLLFVQLVDGVIEKRVHSSHNIRTFLARCCSTERKGQLPAPLLGLLDGALPSWRKVGLLTEQPHESRPTVTFADAGVDAAAKPPLGVPHTPSLSHPMEKEMVTTMIKGLVAECVAGEKKTSEQRQAEEWVAKAGVDALNRYARSWVRTMHSD